MRLTRIYLFLSFMIFTAYSGTGNNGILNKQAAEEVVPGVVIVKFKKEYSFARSLQKTGVSGLDQVLEKQGITRLDRVFSQVSAIDNHGIGNIYYARFMDPSSPFVVAGELQKNTMIEWAEPKYIHYIEQEIPLIPNDSLYSQQDFYDVIQAPYAWNSVRGETGNTIIAIIDGGTDIDHPDLADNIWINEDEIAGDGIDNDGNGFTDDINGWNFPDESNDPNGLLTTPLNANHGTLTAGLAGAVSDNQSGVAGASWNAVIMPVNAGSPTSDNSILFGYNGIRYAAQNGARIINCSWGRSGGASQFEQNVINEITSLGAVIVAAAGNDDLPDAHFPSSYKNVLSVASTQNNDIKAGFSNYGPDVDVSTPGSSLYSTFNGGGYGRASGTSVSSPVTAGIIGLVHTQNPSWTGVQAAEQVRVTADNIDASNPAYVGMLGKGRINALRAVTETSPSIRISGVSFSETDGDGIIEPGENVAVSLTVINYLSAAQNISLALNVEDPFVTVTQANALLSSIGELDTVTISEAFGISVSESAPGGYRVEFTVDISTGVYEDSDSFPMTILPTFGTIAVNNIEMTVTNVGRIGSADLDDPEQGIGFVYRDGPNLLFEGAVIAGTAADRISNAARNASSGYDSDFMVAEGGEMQIVSPGTISDEESLGSFDDRGAGNPMNIRVEQQTFARSDSGFDDFVIFKYRVENTGESVLDNFHFGLFFDWDLDAVTYLTNRIGYDAGRKLGYAFDTQAQGPETYVGMSALSQSAVSFRAIYNDQSHASNPPWGIYDGYTDQEKWESISGGVSIPTAGPGDVSFAISHGPYSLSPGQIVTIGFAMVAGDDLNALQMHADSAMAFWQEILPTDIEKKPPVLPPDDFTLSQNYPNPFNPETKIEFEVPKKTRVRLGVYNLLGERVRILIDSEMDSGAYQARWDGRNDRGGEVAAGVYIYRLSGEDFSLTRKMLLLK